MNASRFSFPSDTGAEILKRAVSLKLCLYKTDDGTHCSFEIEGGGLGETDPAAVEFLHDLLAEFGRGRESEGVQ